MTLKQILEKLGKKDEKIKPKVRRVYDILNVFKTLGFIEHEKRESNKSIYSWNRICIDDSKKKQDEDKLKNEWYFYK